MEVKEKVQARFRKLLSAEIVVIEVLNVEKLFKYFIMTLFSKFYVISLPTLKTNSLDVVFCSNGFDSYNCCVESF